MEQNNITFEGVNFNIAYITKDMSKDFKYAHIWHGRSNRDELFKQLYSLTHADDQQHVTSAKTTGHTSGASERSL